MIRQKNIIKKNNDRFLQKYFVGLNFFYKIEINVNNKAYTNTKQANIIIDSH